MPRHGRPAGASWALEGALRARGSRLLDGAGHPGQNGAAATVLLAYYNDEQTFTLTTGANSRTYQSISQARSDGNNARVWGGMHYPSTIAASDGVGAAIASYVNANAMLR